jgi:hypothetical protein
VEPASTATDRQDATFTVVAGLANAACVSFRSANLPTRYLRHYNFRVRLDVNSGDATFARDATFCGRAGLAGGTSFESYSHPGRYLRHFNYELRVDLLSTGSTFAGDASFTVTAPLA